MKYLCFVITALAALNIGTKAEGVNRIGLSIQLSNPIYGLNVESSGQPNLGSNGMTWGIVVNTAGDSDFSMLSDSLSAGWFSGGVGKSGQWIGDDLVYLAAGAKTRQVGPFAGAITSASDIPGTGDNYNLPVDQTYSFVIIWFQSSIETDQTPDAGDRYGYLNVEGFVIPKMDDLNGRTVDLSAILSEGNVAGLVRTGYFTAIPEPATYALLIAGLALGGTAIIRRRRAKCAAR